MNPPARSTKSDESFPRAAVKSSRWSWTLWLIPLGAAGLCAWFAWRDFAGTGPAVTISFENAEGLEEKNTQLKFRGINVGEVKYIGLSKDGLRVEVKARLTGTARNLARAGSLFWIVRPELKIGSISGLRTIVSGEYIAVRPGNGPLTNSFKGAENEPPVERPGALLISFLSPSLGSLQEGSPIFYRGVIVGEVLDFQLAADARAVTVHGRIWEEYAPLVRPESKFWNAGGLELRAGLFKGVEINAQSPKTLFSGGIEFATPPEFGAIATNGTTFVLSEKADDKWKTWAPAIHLQVSGMAAPAKEAAGLNGNSAAGLIDK